MNELLLSRFTACLLQDGVEIPYSGVKANIAKSLNLVVQIDRGPGKRFASEVLEVMTRADGYSFDLVFRTRHLPLTVYNKVCYKYA